MVPSVFIRHSNKISFLVQQKFKTPRYSSSERPLSEGFNWHCSKMYRKSWAYFINLQPFCGHKREILYASMFFYLSEFNHIYEYLLFILAVLVIYLPNERSTETNPMPNFNRSNQLSQKIDHFFSIHQKIGTRIFLPILPKLENRKYPECFVFKIIKTLCQWFWTKDCIYEKFIFTLAEN